VAIYSVSAGNVIVVLDANQYKNWLVDGTITDTPLVLNYATISTAAATITNTGGAGALGLTINGTVGVGSIAVNNAALYLTPSLSLVSTGQYGLYSNVAFTSAATVSGVAIYAKLQTAASAFTMTSGYGVYIADAVKGATSSITTQYGLYVAAQTQGSTNYSIYTAGTSDMVSIGYTVASNPALLGIGTTSVSTAAGQYGIDIRATFNSSATSFTTGLETSTTGGTGTYTTSSVYGILVTSHTKGANQTITTLYGINIGAPSATCTTAYGIYINAPTGGSGNNIGLRVGAGINISSDPTAGVASTFSLGATTGIGNGANTNIQAPVLGGGTGPTTATLITGWLKAWSGTAVVWIPFAT
jgi:hypothetical protein